MINMMWVIPISGMRPQRFVSVGNLEALVLWLRRLVSWLGELCCWIRGWDDWVRKRPSPEIAHSQSSQCPPASDSETCFSLWMEDCDAGDVDGTCACVCLCVCVWQVFIQTQASLLCKLSICKIKTLQKPPIFQTLFSGKSDPKKKSKVDCRINSNICYVPSKILNTVSWRT